MKMKEQLKGSGNYGGQPPKSLARSLELAAGNGLFGENRQTVVRGDQAISILRYTIVSRDYKYEDH
jgi:hypothetical protein